MQKRHHEFAAEKHLETTGTTIHMATLYDIGARLLGIGVNSRINRMVVEMANIKPGDRVLDVGCGTGNLTLTAEKYAGATGSVYGLEASPEMLDAARRKVKTTASEVVFELGLIENIPYSDATFDVVICNLVLHHLPDELKRQAFKETYRVLKPGGITFMTDFNIPTHSVLTHVFLTLFFHRRMLQSGFNMPAIPPMLAEAGFADVASGPTRSAFLAFATGKKPAGFTG